MKKLSLVFFLIFGLLNRALAENLPTGFNPISGNLSASQTGNTLNVVSGSNNSIAEWNGFSIGKDYSVNISLPGGNSAILNRVVGNDPSNIFGSLWSNGRVFLINPNGFLFGAGSVINAGSFIASTLNISNNDFLNGNYIFKQLNSNPSSITNEGTITTSSGGTINLFSSAINNKGILSAPGGQINLAVGEQISFANNGIGYQVTVDKALLNKINNIQTAISNSGIIKADLIKLKASFQQGLYGLAVNNSGLIQADAVVKENGVVQLVASNGSNNSGLVLNTGEIKSSGLIDLQVGSVWNRGTISADGDINLNLTETTTISRNSTDRSLIHNPNGSVDYPLSNRPSTENTTFSLYNEAGGLISAGHDVNIMAPRIYNTSSSIEAGHDLNITADLLVNERTGFWTKNIPLTWGGNRAAPYVHGLWEKSDASDRYEYWVDQPATSPEGYLGAGDDMNLLVGNTVNKDSLIEVGHDLKVKGSSFSNNAKVLMGTQYHAWRSRRRNRSYFEPAGIAKGVNNFSSVFVGNNANFDLNGNFNNSSNFQARGNFAVKAQNANIGILDNKVLTPPPSILPEKFFINLWDLVPLEEIIKSNLSLENKLSLESNSNAPISPSLKSNPTVSLSSLQNLGSSYKDTLARALRSQLFNLSGKSFIGDEWQSANNSLNTLLQNAQNAIAKNTGLVWGQALNREQINSLDGPVLWFESGSLVVYVPESLRKESRPEGYIQANNINFEIKDKFYNSGTVIANNDLSIDANEILNEARTVTRSKDVRVNKGLFRGETKTVFYDEIQSGGNLVGNNISLNASKSITNRGGSISATENVSLTAPEVVNEAQRGSELVTWKSTTADKLFGNKNTSLIKPVFQGASISGNTVEINGNTVQNLGSSIYGEESVSIKAEDSVTNSWLTGTYTTKDNTNLKFGRGSISLNRDAVTAHVTQGASIASGGNVEIEVGGSQDGTRAPSFSKTFNNVAADVYAGNDIKIQAGSINITDGTVSSIDKHSSTTLQASLPATVSLTSQNTKNTKTTQQSSNFVAGNNIELNAEKNIGVTGSNLVAGNEINLEAKNIEIKAGEYTDTTKTVGGEINIGWTGGMGVGVNASIYAGEGESKVLTSSNLIAKEIEINSTNNTKIEASNITAKEKLEINTPNLEIIGKEMPFHSQTSRGGAGVNLDVLQGGFSVSVNGTFSEMEGGRYISSTLSAPSLLLNSPNQRIEGVTINGKEINPKRESWSETNSYGGGISFNPFTGAVGINASYNDYSIFAGAGENGGFLGGGYKDFIVGSNLGSASERTGSSLGVFAGYAGLGTLGLSHSSTNGTSTHDVWSTNFNLLGLNGGASFQEGNYIGSTLNFGSINLASNIQNPFNYTCFPAGTRIRIRRRRANGTYEEIDLEIENLKIGDEILSFNEISKKLEWQEVKQVFNRKAFYLQVIMLSDGSLIKATGEHPFYVQGKWVEARDLKLGDKLFSLHKKLVEIVMLGKIEYPAGIEVFNLRVGENHNYFAEGILVHNTYSLEDAQRQNELGERLIEQKMQPIEPVEALKGSVTAGNLSSSLTIEDLRKITGRNSNLTSTQKVFYASELLKAQKDYQAGKKEQALKRAKEVQVQVQLLQAQKAIESGFIAKEANKNLKAAEGTLKAIKGNIKDPKLEKSFDEITKKVFWEEATITGTHWLKSLGKVVDDWSVTNNLEKYAADNLKDILKNTQKEYVKTEISKLEAEKKKMIELGGKIIQAKDGAQILYNTTYGDPNNDPTMMTLAEKEYQVENTFAEKKLTNVERAKEVVHSYKTRLEGIKNMPESEAKSKAMKKYWNELTSEIESSETMLRKWEHVKRWIKSGHSGNNPLPYYVAEFDKYLKPYIVQDKNGVQHLVGEAYRKELSTRLTTFRQTEIDAKIKEILPYLKDKETGLYSYAGLPSPISLEDASGINYAAHEGSRYLGSTSNHPEYYFRLHAGQDIGGYGGIGNKPVRSVINGTILVGPIPKDRLVSAVELTIETGDGYAIRYRHMPPDSYSQFKTGDMVSTNDIVGKVGGYSSRSSTGYDPHLHFEILRGTKMTDIKTDKTWYNYDTSLDPSRVIIAGGKIREK